MTKERNIRDKHLNIKLTGEELEKIRNMQISSICQNLSEYGRKKLLDKPVTIKYRNASLDDFVAEMILLRNELISIGNNFDQSVKKLYSLNCASDVAAWAIGIEKQKVELFKKTTEIKDLIIKMFEQWSQ